MTDPKDDNVTIDNTDNSVDETPVTITDDSYSDPDHVEGVDDSMVDPSDDLNRDPVDYVDDFESGDDYDDPDFEEKKSSPVKTLVVMAVIIIAVGGLVWFFLLSGNPVPFSDSARTASNSGSTILPPLSLDNGDTSENTNTNNTNETGELTPPPMPIPIETDISGPDETTTMPTPSMNTETVPAPTRTPPPMTGDNGMDNTIPSLDNAAAQDDFVPSPPSQSESINDSEIVQDIPLPDITKTDINEDASADDVRTQTEAADLAAEIDTATTTPITNSDAQTGNNNTSPVNTGEMDVNGNRLSTLESSINEIEQAILLLNDRIKANAANASSTANSGASDAAPQTEAIEMLNQKMAQISYRLDQITERMDAMVKEQSLTDNTVAPPSAEKPAPKKSIKKPVTASKPAAVRAKSTTSTSTKPQLSTPNWVLRSAQPGVAWLSKSGVNEMGRYTVGQTLSGLGTILSITQENGRWIVRASQGTIRQ